MAPQQLRIFVALISTYVVFAILLNSVGTVILQSITTFEVSKSAASTLEGFKDIPIAIVSFLLASYLPRLGYKKAMLIGMVLVTIASILMPIMNSFWMTKVLFLCVGISFGLSKVAVYTLIGQVSENPQKHASNMNILEGCFMLGVLSSYWIFGFFMDPHNPTSPNWLNVYWLLAVVSVANFLLVLFSPIETPADHIKKDETPLKSFQAMLKLALLPFVMMFVLSAFFYVLIEQGVGTWLPTFNKDILNLSNSLSVQLASIFAASLAVGRLSAGVILRKVNWYPFLLVSLVAMATLLVLVVPMTADIDASNTVTSWSSLPLAALFLPLVGLFMAPIYPAISSVVLSALPKANHASMTGLIVIFSALGGTFGSLLTGVIFDNFDGQTAFMFMLVPIFILIVSLTFYRNALKKRSD